MTRHQNTHTHTETLPQSRERDAVTGGDREIVNVSNVVWKAGMQKWKTKHTQIKEKVCAGQETVPSADVSLP